MKKILFAMVATLLFVALSAQDKTLYIVFTSLNRTDLGKPGTFNPVKTGIFHRTRIIRGEMYHNFVFFNKDAWINYETDLYTFTNVLWVDPIPAEIKPKSFLNTIDYIDWDVEAPGLNEPKARARYKEFEGYNTFYFIDRLDSTADSIKIVKTILIRGQI